jgi:uncharacterized protein
MEIQSLWLFVLMPLVAFLYASVGHGGASSYIALLTILQFSPVEIRSTALLLNTGVSAVSFITFYKSTNFQSRLFLVLVACSIPASFLGGYTVVDAYWYQKILGLVLIFPMLKLFGLFPLNTDKPVERKWWMVPIAGLAIGYVSGLIGIGGGIILSPLLLLLGWANVKQTAALSAGFIFLNSLSGLAGTGLSGFSFHPQLLSLVPLTMAGGILGAWMGANRFSIVSLKYLLGLVLLVASTKFIVN